MYPMTDANEYEGLLRAFFGESPAFDLLLLGMGDDGHTASLFPGSISLLEDERWVIEPPDVVKGMARITLTLPALNAARRTLFLVCGVAKYPALARIAAGERLPAALVRTPSGWWTSAAPAVPRRRWHGIGSSGTLEGGAAGRQLAGVRGVLELAEARR